MKPTRKDPSQSEIAERAGVARTTVSLVLRGGEGLKPETVERVKEAAKELGYRPNMLVQGIRTGKSRMVGVMIPPYDSHWSQVVYGIHDELAKNDYAPIFLWSAHRDEEMDEKRELKQVHRLLDRRIDGVVLWPHFARMYEQHIHEFSLRNLPVVTVDCRINGSVKADAVLSDDRAGAKAVAEHLLGLGHKNIIHFCGPETEEWSRMRREGFETTPNCISVEVPLKPPRTAIIRKALEAYPETTAVFASTDHIAQDVYEAATELGLCIPVGLSVVGYSDLDFSKYLAPPLTTVHACPYEMGRRAAQMVMERIAGNADDAAAQAEYLPVELVVRKSTRSI
ncbi:MAG: LacI family transcriptional regulator [Kiritimatiellales bacterium]|nr:LacI family transcriptional regulator [Kiritimatiellales bacterium]